MNGIVIIEPITVEAFDHWNFICRFFGNGILRRRSKRISPVPIVNEVKDRIVDVTHSTDKGMKYTFFLRNYFSLGPNLRGEEKGALHRHFLRRHFLIWKNAFYRIENDPASCRYAAWKFTPIKNDMRADLKRL